MQALWAPDRSSIDRQRPDASAGRAFYVSAEDRGRPGAGRARGRPGARARAGGRRGRRGRVGAGARGRGRAGGAGVDAGGRAARAGARAGGRGRERDAWARARAGGRRGRGRARAGGGASATRGRGRGRAGGRVGTGRGGAGTGRAADRSRARASSADGRAPSELCSIFFHQERTSNKLPRSTRPARPHAPARGRTGQAARRPIKRRGAGGLRAPTGERRANFVRSSSTRREHRTNFPTDAARAPARARTGQEEARGDRRPPAPTAPGAPAGGRGGPPGHAPTAGLPPSPTHREPCRPQWPAGTSPPARSAPHARNRRPIAAAPPRLRDAPVRSPARRVRGGPKRCV